MANNLRIGHLTDEVWRPGASYLTQICSNPSHNLQHAVFCNKISTKADPSTAAIYSRELSHNIRATLSRRLSSRFAANVEEILTSHIWDNFLRKCNPNVLHAQDGKQTIQWLPFIEKTTLPLVVTFHGSDINSATFNTKHHLGLKRVFERADHLHFVSNALMQHGTEIGAPPEKSSVIYLGTPIRDLTNYSRRTHDCVFGIAANLVPCKGHEILLNSFKKTREQLNNSKLHIWGDGPLRARLTWLTQKLGISDCVVFHGHVAHRNVLRIMRETTDIVVQPSRRDDHGSEEGLPLSLCEASAAGIPCIGSDCGGIKELIIHKQTGHLVPQEDVKELTDSMLNLALNPEERQRLGIAASKRTQLYFNTRLQMGKLAELYIEICSKKSRRNPLPETHSACKTPSTLLDPTEAQQ